MFSVSATPFNSKARQLYGGWTPQQAREARKPYEEKLAHEIIAKIAPSGSDEQIASKRWLKMYKILARTHPELKAGMRQRSRSYALGKFPIDDRQRANMLRIFYNSVPIQENPSKLVRAVVKAFKQGGLPNVQYVNTLNGLTVPEMGHFEYPDFPMDTIPDPAPLGGVYYPRLPPITAADLVQEFGDQYADSAEAALESWRQYRRELAARRPRRPRRGRNNIAIPVPAPVADMEDVD